MEDQITPVGTSPATAATVAVTAWRSRAASRAPLLSGTPKTRAAPFWPWGPPGGGIHR